jgi:Fe-S-cluster containining protein
VAESPSPVSSAAPEHLSAQVELRLAGVQVQLALTVPTAPVHAGVILPIFQSLSEAIEADAVAGAQGQGKRISCRAGCGACCRQLVPISEIEARCLAELVALLPEPRRSAIRARFAEALARLEAAGLLETVRHLERVDVADKESLALTYFHLGIACPFLEDESCSIYPQRPLSCREYLVTSPAENCSHPTKDNVKGFKLPVRLSGMLARFSKECAAARQPWVPLILALERAESEPDGSPARPGPEWVTLLFEKLSGQEVPAPET